MPDEADSHELAGQHPPLAGTAGGAEAAHPLGGNPGGRGAEHGVRGGAGAGGEIARDTRPDRATRYLDTALGVLSYAQLAPLLADRVVVVEAAIYSGAFQARELADDLFLDLHTRICADLVPEWAGRWRSIEVRVGNLHPPLPHQVPVLMRDYARDLAARWEDAAATPGPRTLEFLAFAEGRFLTIHPFRDFNGRTIRLVLRELLRRLDFPRIHLEPEPGPATAAYYLALESADRHDFAPLIGIWQERLQ